MEDLGCAVVSQGIVVMREWKIKDAQCATNRYQGIVVMRVRED